MGRKRGFWAELQHQQRLAEQRQRDAYVAAYAAHTAAALEAERAQREYERAVAAAAHAAERRRWEAEAEARRAHERALLAAAEANTQRAISAFQQIDAILAATLDVDDYVDIAALKQTADHPPFDSAGLDKPTPKPTLHSAPPEPQFTPPPAPTGLSKLFGKQKHVEATQQAHAEWAQQHQTWRDNVERVLPSKNASLLEMHAASERQRAERLAAAQMVYDQDCADRERAIAEANSKLDEFARALEAGELHAIHEYVGIVLGNSVYPDAFPVDHEFQFDPELGELTVTVIIPPPSELPAVKLYKYLQKTGETRETPCTQKEQRERYNGAVAAVAVRTFHEVFESDREGRIQTISLTVQTETIHPATGLPEAFPFVAAAADRHDFARYDLHNVDPTQTLTYMNALVSKNPFALKPISSARGVRS